MAFKLTIEQGTGRGQSFDFSEDEVVIGRDEACDVILNETGVSRRHASLRRAGDGFRVVDHGSANGTLVNGRKVSDQLLAADDTIEIAGVVFRYEPVEVTAAGANSTATSAVTPDDEDRTNPGAAMPAAAGAKGAQAPGGSDVLRKLVVGLMVVIVAGAVGVFAFEMLRTEETAVVCPELIGVNDADGLVFGPGGDYDCGPKLRFAFIPEDGTRLLFHYAPFLVEAGEVDILLNGQRLGSASQAPFRTPQAATLELSDALLKKGETNIVELVNRRGESWGVQDVSLEVIRLAEANLEDGQRAFALAERRYKERHIAARNLYEAWVYFRDARRKFEGLDEKPIEYQAAVEMSLQARRDLDKQCREKLFEAQQKAVYARYEEANSVYRFIELAFPENDHPCRAMAQDRMYAD